MENTKLQVNDLFSTKVQNRATMSKPCKCPK